ncbi:MAG: ParA family protein, partial [Oleispira antarctica]|nr:ParA family protein [Oleispira antarctica]MBQ0792504.1 ParA family protein [Oleispira antarctica]
IVPTLFDRRTQASVITLKEMRELYPEHVWQEAIPIDTKFRDASHDGLFPNELDSLSRGVRAYRHLLAVLDQAEEVKHERRSAQ